MEQMREKCIIHLCIKNHLSAPHPVTIPNGLSKLFQRLPQSSIHHTSISTCMKNAEACLLGLINAWDAHCKHTCPHFCKVTLDQSHMQPGFHCWPKKQTFPRGFHCILSCANSAFTNLTSASQDSDMCTKHINQQTRSQNISKFYK